MASKAKIDRWPKSENQIGEKDKMNKIAKTAKTAKQANN